MDFLRSNSMVMMERSMDFLWTKQAAIMDNIANAETPNYKAKVVTFEQNLTQKLQQAAIGGKRSGQNVRQVLEDADFAVYDIDEAKRQRRGRHGTDGGDGAHCLSAAVPVQRHQQELFHPAHGCAGPVRGE